MAKKDQERDWDKELREVDRLLNQLPTHREEQMAAAASPKRVAAGPAVGGGGAPRDSGSRLGTWARVGLGLLVGIGMPFWPYSHGCGFKLLFYLVGVLAVIVAGVWSGLSSWKRRMGLAHLLSQLLVIWGLVMAAAVVLPRVGYAKDAATWLCP